MFSQLLNLNAIFTNVSTGAISTGVVTETAENKDDSVALGKLFSTSFKINIVLSAVLFIVTLLFSRPLSRLFFDNDYDGKYIILISFCSGFWGILLIFSSILNGFSRNKEYLVQSLAVSLFFGLSLLTFLFTENVKIFFCIYFLSQVILVFLLLPGYIKKKYWSLRHYLNRIFDRDIVKNLGKFVIMSMTSVILVNMSQIIIRTYIIKSIGQDYAGLWDAMMKISLAYFGVLSSGLSIYYLPKIASTNDTAIIKHEVLVLFKIFAPVLIVGFTLIYLLRNSVVALLYSPQFEIIAAYFLPVLIADFFKWIAWLYSYILMAKKKTNLFMFNESLFTLLQIVLVIGALHFFGFNYLFYAYPIMFFFYLISSYFLANKFVFQTWRK